MIAETVLYYYYYELVVLCLCFDDEGGKAHSNQRHISIHSCMDVEIVSHTQKDKQ